MYWLIGGFLVLLLNSAYLAAYATASLFYFAQVVIHMLLGVALAAAGGWWLISRRRSLPRFPNFLYLDILLLAIGAGFGLALMYFGGTRPHRWMLLVHIATTAVGAAGMLAHVAVFSSRMAPGLARTLVRTGTLVAFICSAGAVFARMNYDTQRKAEYQIVNPARVPLSMQEEGAGPKSPFFPSSANTNVNGIIPANFFMTSQACARCHRQIYEEWNESAHHFSSFNNQWYRRSIEYMQDVIGTQPSKWCAGCHDHAVFFNGRFDKPIKEQINTPEAQAGLACTSCHAITHVAGTMGQGGMTVEYPPLHDLAVSEQPALRWVHDKLLEIDPQPHRETFLKPFHRDQTPEFCSSCHKVHLDVPVNGYRWLRGFNDYDNWQASGVSGLGARSFYYPAKPQKCADCHMPLVASDDPAAKNGQIRSHRFAAANTALPFVNGHQKQLEAVQKFLRDGQVSVDIFGLVRTPGDEGADGVAASGGRPSMRAGGQGQRQGQAEGQTQSRPRAADGAPEVASTFAVGEESMNFGAARGVVLTPPAKVVGPLGPVQATVKRGESLRLEVVVRTRKVGHFFPGGTVDAFDVWVEVEAVDSNGKTIFHSGQALDDGKGPVEPGAHMYRSLQLDDQGNWINKRNAWMTRSVAYVRLIPPGAADTIHYRLRIPPDVGDRITITAKVNYRKFTWWNTQWAFAGVRDPEHKDFALAKSHDSGRWLFTGDTSQVSGKVKAIPDIPTTTMAENATTVRVIDAKAALPDEGPRLDKALRERWNDYGIGLLLQGDLKGAEAAFLKVTEMDPGYADGWVNVGRARSQEGNMAGAEEILRKALAVNGRLASAHFFLGTVLKSLGRYDEAVEHLQAASASYPYDRVVRNQLGRVLFLERRYAPAVEQFKAALGIDPEDLQAHYNLMLCYQGLGQPELAAQERTLYERFKADESAQAITGPYRQLHPDDNNERQSIHEHRSVAPGGGVAATMLPYEKAKPPSRVLTTAAASAATAARAGKAGARPADGSGARTVGTAGPGAGAGTGTGTGRAPSSIQGIQP
jgi:tetratricopeptide (TPR) repeat protein